MSHSQTWACLVLEMHEGAEHSRTLQALAFKNKLQRRLAIFKHTEARQHCYMPVHTYIAKGDTIELA